MPKESTEPILIGCELLVRKGDQLLLGLRGKACFGAGTWALPGGHLEFGEKLIDAAQREALEELGVKISANDMRLASIVDGIEPNGPHYIHFSFEVIDPSWQPRIMEPDSCDEWRYFDIHDLPDNFFPPHTDIVHNYLNGTLYNSSANL